MIVRFLLKIFPFKLVLSVLDNGGEIMNSILSRMLIYYPATLLKGEPVFFLERQYRKSQFMSRKNLRSYQLNHLRKIVSFAYRKSRFYKELYDSNGFRPDDLVDISDINKIPIIDKRLLIENFKNMSILSYSLIASRKTTGGSTGQPVQLLKNPMALARERAATARGYNWAGVSSGDPQLRLWGIPHGERDAFKAGIIDFVSNRKRISAFNLTDDKMFSYYKEALWFKPKFIYGYVSAINEFANFIRRKGLKAIPSVESVVTTSEILTSSVRSNIENIFKAKVYNEYGCGEVGSIAHECEAGNMHIMADNLVLESESKGDVPGELIVTDLFNFALPLIRYRLGDFAILSDNACDCGRTLPLIRSLHGRAYDMLEMPDGRKVHPESAIYIFEDIQKRANVFEQFQVIQSSTKNIAVNIIPSDGYSDSVREMILQGVKSNLHEDICVTINIVDFIPREPSGKMRVVKKIF